MSSPSQNFSLSGSSRVTRLMLKELREILRDRRTIITLVLMPLILYPLLSVAFQQFFLSNLAKKSSTRYQIGFANPTEARPIMLFLGVSGGMPFAPADSEVSDEGTSKSSPTKLPEIEGLSSKSASNPKGDQAHSAVAVAGVYSDLERAVRQQAIDVGIRYKRGSGRLRPLPHRDLTYDRDLAYDVELLWNRDSVLSRQGLEFVQKYLQRGNSRFLGERLKVLKVEQRGEPVIAHVVDLEDSQSSGGSSHSASIIAIIPLVLIMMTVTGAVYPAIDLTAGERERGTLEILVAAPIPRIGLLFAKYVAVVAVALLTAAVNLIMMTMTLFLSGMGKALFGPHGLPLSVIAQVFGVLILFAGFFSAVLLVLTSFARSFKEAQAYLIPLMLVSLAPGALCLKTDLKLEGLWLVTPLVNIVLLARDLFNGTGTNLAVIMVVISTVLYALAAISVAARIFGAESVLYSTPTGWGDLVSRPTKTRKTATVAGAMLTLALLFPALFVAKNTIPRLATAWVQGAAPWEDVGITFTELPPDRQLSLIRMQLALGGIATALVFAGFPWLASRWRRIQFKEAFSLRMPNVISLLGCLLLGLSLWTAAHELVVLESKIGLVSIDLSKFESTKQIAALLPQLPLPLILLSMAAAPAICEEWFFRGYLFSALRVKYSPVQTIVISALLFGVFHVVGQGAFTLERLLPSTFLGLVLGWVCWRTRSIFPGMLLHFLHNGLLVTLGYFQPELKARGWDIAPAAGEFAQGENQLFHLPFSWLAVAALLATAGFLMVQMGSRGQEPSNEIRPSAS